jgi:hypothetical protein
MTQALYAHMNNEKKKEKKKYFAYIFYNNKFSLTEKNMVNYNKREYIKED